MLRHPEASSHESYYHPRAEGKRGENSVPGAQSELEPVEEA